MYQAFQADLRVERLFFAELDTVAPSLRNWIQKGLRNPEMSDSPQLSPAEDSPNMEGLPDDQLDGPIDLASLDMPKRRRLSGDVCAIFVHAGAGYHSLQNEKVHLSACEE